MRLKEGYYTAVLYFLLNLNSGFSQEIYTATYFNYPGIDAVHDLEVEVLLFRDDSVSLFRDTAITLYYLVVIVKNVGDSTVHFYNGGYESCVDNWIFSVENVSFLLKDCGGGPRPREILPGGTVIFRHHINLNRLPEQEVAFKIGFIPYDWEGVNYYLEHQQGKRVDNHFIYWSNEVIADFRGAIYKYKDY
jgi:hypothetical protein